MNAILRSVTPAEQKVVAAVYRAESHLLSDHYHRFNYPQLEWNLISIKKKLSFDASSDNPRRNPDCPGRAAAPGMSLAQRITAPQAHTVLHVGTGRCSDQTPDIQRRGFSHPWGCSTQWTIPSWWAGNHLKLKGLPQLISASLLHVKPKPREIICHGIWRNQASYIRGGLGLLSFPLDATIQGSLHKATREAGHKHVLIPI